MACDLCRKRKVRCDGKQPCYHCRVGGLACLYHSVGGFPSDVPTQALEDGSSVYNTSNESVDEHPIQVNDVHATPDDSTSLDAETTIAPSLPQEIGGCSFQSREGPGLSKPETGIEAMGAVSNSFMCFDSSFPVGDDLGNVTMTDFWELPALVRHNDYFMRLEILKIENRRVKYGGTI